MNSHQKSTVPLLFITAIVAFLFGTVQVVTSIAQEIEEDPRWQKYATTTLSTTEIEQTLILEEKLDLILKRQDDIQNLLTRLMYE